MVGTTNSNAESNGSAKTKSGIASRTEKTAFENRMKAVLASQEQVIAGELCFVDINRLREKFGSKWNEVQNVVYKVASNIINQNLTIEDFFTLNDGKFIVIFPNLTKEEAKEKCDEIAAAIDSHIDGNNKDFPDLSLKSTVVETTEDDIMHTEDPFLVLEDMLALELEHQEDPIIQAALQKEKEDKIAEQDRIERAQQSSDKIPANVEFVYRPMWHTKTKKIYSYSCLPYLKLKSGTVLTGDQVLPGHANHKSVAQLDYACLEQIHKALSIESVRNEKTFLTFPVHFSTLVDKIWRIKYNELITKIKPYKHRLIAEIIGLPYRLSELDAAIIKKIIGSATRSCIARVVNPPEDFSCYAMANIVSIGFDLSELKTSEKYLIAMFEIYVEAANENNLMTYIHGLPSLSLTTAAVCAGFDNIDGDTVSKFSEMPKQIYPLDPRNLYSHLLDNSNI